MVPRYYGWLTLLIIVATALLDSLSSAGVADWAPYPIAVMTALWWKGQRGVLATAVVTAGLTMAGGWVSGFGDFHVNWASRMLGIGLISLVGGIALQVERYDRERRQTLEALRQNERELLAVAQQLESANRDLERLSSIDGLTGIRNRRHLESVLRDEWGRARRGHHPLAVIMADIDWFKAYNDTYGHQAGDDCLKKVAETLQATLKRPGDMVGRYGGEEFLMILPETDEKGAVAVAEAARSKIEALAIPHTGAGASGQVTLSLGTAATIPLGDGDSAHLIAAADRALYQSKAKGRNRVTVHHVGSTSEPSS